MNKLNGLWNCKLSDGYETEIYLPSTLDEGKIGHADFIQGQVHPDDSLGQSIETSAHKPISSRLTRRFTYEGQAEFSRIISVSCKENMRYFVFVERARRLELYVNGRQAEIYEQGTLSTPWIFEITDCLLSGENEFLFYSDNSYKGMPREDILFSSAASDETQTNWNGLLGRFELIEKNPVFIKDISVKKEDDSYSIAVQLDGENIEDYRLDIASDIVVAGNRIKADAARWDIEEPVMHTAICRLIDDNGVCIEESNVNFGIRDIGAIDGHLSLNKRKIFLLGETNCALYPESGHVPMLVEEWEEILAKYKSYGMNFVRFHSHCPPEAAFTAADGMGMILQVELSNWNPKSAFLTDESRQYYETELRQILRFYNRHPSFCFLSLGNELCTDEAGHRFMDYLLDIGREIDASRMYANGSNVHYGEMGCDKSSDFYMSQSLREYKLRGTSAGEPTPYNGYTRDSDEPIPLQGYINNTYPNCRTNYDETIKAIRMEYPGPVIGFETGQYEMLPDFDELSDFKGVTEPVNYELIKEAAIEKGMSQHWKGYVEATGELALIAYKEEIEAAFRTKGFSGTVLLGLQDFSGQGTALVGMMNAHLKPKPYSFAAPERFRAFCDSRHVMLLLERYTYYTSDCLEAAIQIANYSRKPIGGEAVLRLFDRERCVLSFKVAIPEVEVGDSIVAATVSFRLPESDINKKYELEIEIGDLKNKYPIWVYTRDDIECPEGIYISQKLDSRVIGLLSEGKKVFLEPPTDREHLPNSIATQFTTDFWSVGTFVRQEGSMGQYIDKEHPVFKNFPTEFHSNWQWFKMASSRAVLLPDDISAIITEIDSYAYMRHLGQLFECNCLNGKLLFSSMGLHFMEDYPEVRALTKCIYDYMDSDDFDPDQKIGIDTLKTLVN